MKYLFFILSFFAFAISSFAQEEQKEEEVVRRTQFLEHVENNDGKSSVVINMDARLISIINGKNYNPDEKKFVEVRKVVTKQKLKGYRIQVYWGGNKQSEKSKAQMEGYKVTSSFPELNAYTSFESPHWRCRVGDFATQKEAEEYLKKIKHAKIVTNPIIVKSEIFGFK